MEIFRDTREERKIKDYKMKVLKLQDKLNNVPKRWSNQYINTKNEEKIYINNALHSLDKPLRKEDIDKIIGNDSWTSFKCEECDKQVDTLVYYEGKHFDGYEGPNIALCKSCLTNGLEILKGL